MLDSDLEKYCRQAVEKGATHAKQIHPSSVVTAEWVRWKCQFGCPNYNKKYSCPPDTPRPDQTRALVDCYRRAILFHKELQYTRGRGELRQQFLSMLVELEGQMFKDGYYKSLVIIGGSCRICEECAKLEGTPCRFGTKSRPSMEACGIDVYQTARNNGFFIVPLKEKTETQNWYSLLLVD